MIEPIILSILVGIGFSVIGITAFVTMANFSGFITMIGFTVIGILLGLSFGGVISW